MSHDCYSLLSYARHGLPNAMPRGVVTPWVEVRAALRQASADRQAAEARLVQAYADIKAGTLLPGYDKARHDHDQANQAYWLIDKVARRYKEFSK